MIFDKLIQVLVFGCGYRRIADASCSATTAAPPPRRGIALGLAEQLHQLALAAYDRLHGLEPEHLAIDGCITKAPGGGQVAGPSPDASRASSARLCARSRWQPCRPRPIAAPLGQRCRQEQPGQGDRTLVVEGDVDLVQHDMGGWHRKGVLRPSMTAWSPSFSVVRRPFSSFRRDASHLIGRSRLSIWAPRSPHWTRPCCGRRPAPCGLVGVTELEVVHVTHRR